MNSNNGNNPDFNDELFLKVIDKLFPNLFKNLEHWGKVIENPDYSEPKTLLKNIETDIENTIKPLTTTKSKLFFRFMRITLLRSSFIKNEFINIPVKMAKSAKNEAKKDSRYSLLLELISEAESKFPLSSMNVVFAHSDFQKTFPANCSPMPFLIETEKTQGEKRAENAYEAMRRICEHIYQPYIDTIWRLTYLRKGNLFPKDEKKVAYGNKVKYCIQDLPKKYHSLIEFNVMIMRNAPSHNTLDWIYETDSIILRDNEKHLELTVDDLLKKLNSMLQISSITISKVGQLYMFRMFSKDGLMEKLFELIPNCISSNEKKIKEAEKELINFLETWLVLQGVKLN